MFQHFVIFHSKNCHRLRTKKRMAYLYVALFSHLNLNGVLLIAQEGNSPKEGKHEGKQCIISYCMDIKYGRVARCA